jgi:hypothetical protein
VWVGAEGQPKSSDWQDLFFEYADYAARRAEPVQRVVGIQHAERAQRIAIERSCTGDVAGARQVGRPRNDRLPGLHKRRIVRFHAGEDGGFFVLLIILTYSHLAGTLFRFG